MKTMTKVGLLFLVSALPLGANAEKSMTDPKPERTWQGTLTMVDAQDNTFTARRGLFKTTFSVGDHCAISALNRKDAVLSDLYPGEKVMIRYQLAEGIRVANRITEQPLHYAGVVESLDRNDRLITMQGRAFHMQFRVPSDAKVIRWDGKRGALEDLGPGDRLTVTYEMPRGFPAAYIIQDRSETFVGTLDAINLPERLLKASAGSAGEKQFTLAHDCRTIVNGKEKKSLDQLVPGRQYLFTYEDVNGVNVTDRIAPAMGPKSADTASAH